MRYNILVNSINKTGGDNYSNYSYSFNFSSFKEGDYQIGFNFMTTGSKTVQATPIKSASATNVNLTSANQALTAVSTGYEYALTNGTNYTTAESSYLAANFGFHMFNNTATPWISNTGTYNATTGAYLGAVSTTTTTGDIAGEYAQIRLPYYLILNSFSIQNAQNTNTCTIKNFSLVGSNDAGATWVVLKDGLFSTSTRITTENFTTTNTVQYNYFRLIVKDGYSGVNTRMATSILTLNGITYPLGNLYSDLHQIELAGLGSAKNNFTTTATTVAKFTNVIGSTCQTQDIYKDAYVSSYIQNPDIGVMSKPLSSNFKVNLKNANGDFCNIGEPYLLLLSFKKV